VAKDVLPELSKALQEKNVEIVACEQSRAIVPELGVASEADWGTEYHALKLSIRIVPSVQAAVEHINQYGTQHSEAIISKDPVAIQYFTQGVDAASILQNTSTRFTDGGEFGFGAEIGISTQKLHARGPFALKEICTYKYVVSSKGKTRD